MNFLHEGVDISKQRKVIHRHQLDPDFCGNWIDAIADTLRDDNKNILLDEDDVLTYKQAHDDDVETGLMCAQIIEWMKREHIVIYWEDFE